MELTPEVFEKAEFDERRRGYDIDQVETFLEETGTALARLLVQVRKNEERLGQADATLAEADAAIEDARSRADQADRQLRAAETRIASLEEELAELRERPVAVQTVESTADIDQEISQATSTLVMAKRTAESAIREAQVQAETMVEEARTESEQQLTTARSEAAELVVDARRRADDEFSNRKSELVSQIAELQSRHDAEQVSLAAVESQLIDRYNDLDRLIASLSELRTTTYVEGADTSKTSSASGRTPGNDELAVELPDESAALELPDEDHDQQVDDVLVEAEEMLDAEDYTDHDMDNESVIDVEAVEDDEVNDDHVESTTDSDTASADVRVAPQGFDVVDLTGEVESVKAASGDEWAPGSWSELEEHLDEEDAEVDLQATHVSDRHSTASSAQATATRTRPSTRTSTTQQPARADIRDDELEKTQAVPVADAAPRDRFLQELDSAVNEAVPYDEDDEAMKAFFEGSTDAKSRRFGWRR